MTSVPRSQRGATDRTAPLVIGVVSIILLLVIASIDLLKFDALMGMITVLILAIITVPLLRSVARRDDPGVIKILFWGLVLKTVFTMVRYFVITVIYGDNGDAGVYAGGGAVLMDLYRHGHFVLEVPQLANRGAETNRIAVVVGVIYMLTGEVNYVHGDQSYHLKPGDSLLFDSAELHGPGELIKRPITYLSIIVYRRDR